MNFDSDLLCRKCGRLIGYSTPAHRISPRDQAKGSTWLYTVLVVTLICGGAYYLYSGFMKSFEQVQSVESGTYRAPADQPRPTLSRTESDKRQAAPFGNAVKNSSGLTQAGKHNADMEKLMQPAR